MAIQFPPINVGDPAPNDGDIYLYLITQEEFVYDKSDNSWTPKGKASSAFGFQGTLEIKKPAPLDADTGYIYSVSDGALAADVHPSFSGLAGVYDVPQWGLIIFAKPDWLLVNTPTGPWIRTVGGQIQPIVNTDNINISEYANNEIRVLKNAPRSR